MLMGRSKERDRTEGSIAAFFSRAAVPVSDRLRQNFEGPLYKVYVTGLNQA